MHALELVHRVRAAPASPCGWTRALWPITRQTAARPISELVHRAGIEGPWACPRGLRHRRGVAAALGHADLSTTALDTAALGAEARELVARVWT